MAVFQPQTIMSEWPCFSPKPSCQNGRVSAQNHHVRITMLQPKTIVSKWPCFSPKPSCQNGCVSAQNHHVRIIMLQPKTIVSEWPCSGPEPCLEWPCFGPEASSQNGLLEPLYQNGHALAQNRNVRMAKLWTKTHQPLQRKMTVIC